MRPTMRGSSSDIGTCSKPSALRESPFRLRVAGQRASAGVHESAGCVQPQSDVQTQGLRDAREVGTNDNAACSRRKKTCSKAQANVGAHNPAQVV